MNSTRVVGEDERTRVQLKVLDELDGMLSSMSMRFWLRGGWAIDFLLGRFTRQHDDVDLVTWVRHRRRLEAALVDAGFQRIPVSELQTDFWKNDVDISFVYLTRASDGVIVGHGRSDWIWQHDALLPDRFKLGDISARVVSPQQLLEEKATYEEGTGRTLRPKDVASMAILHRMLKNC